MTGATGQVIWAVISDRFRGGRRKSVLIAMMCGGAFICFVAGLIGKTWPALFFAILAGIMGATILAYAPMLHTFCSEAVEPRLAGAAIGSNLLATSVGGAIGPLVFGAVVDASSGSYAVAWFLAAGVVLAGGFNCRNWYKGEARVT